MWIALGLFAIARTGEPAARENTTAGLGAQQ
jgi:hypothetical protein